MRDVKLEFFKTRGRGIGLILCAMLAVEVLWMAWAFHSPDEDDMVWGWMLLLYNHPLLRGIIFPTVAAVLASKLADLEHKSGSLRLLETVQEPGRLYAAKFVCGGVYVTAVALLETAALLLTGSLYGFYGAPDLWAFALTLLFDVVLGLELLAVQLALSMRVKNQALALCVGCGGSFVGLLLMFLPGLPWLRALIPWGQVGALMFVGMDWNKVDRFIGMYYMDVAWPVLFVAVFYLAAAFLIGRRAFVRMEV